MNDLYVNYSNQVHLKSQERMSCFVYNVYAVCGKTRKSQVYVTEL